jgi:hypothetical protein
LNFEKSISIGFRSDEYLKIKKRFALAALRARRTALLLWEPRFSMMTVSPGCGVGMRTCRRRGGSFGR